MDLVYFFWMGGWQTPKSANLPNWTGGCTRHGVRVAIEIKQLLGALRSPHEWLGALKDPPQRPKMAKSDHKGEKIKKLNRINNQGPLFGWFHTQVMYLGIMVQMDTIGPVWGTVGGQKWPKMDPKILTISENEKKKWTKFTNKICILVSCRGLTLT